MLRPLMPKASAVWLIDNTTLSFDQIADFCGLHPLEIQSIADGEVALHMVGFDPVANGQLTIEEIRRCEADPDSRLRMESTEVPLVTRAKGPRYTPVARRQDRPDGIAWLLRNFPNLTDGQVARLVGTTKPTIKAIRERTHWNITNIKPQDPVALGLCTREELQSAIDKANRAAARVANQAERAAARREREAAAERAPAPEEAAPEAEPATDVAVETYETPASDVPPEEHEVPEPVESGEPDGRPFGGGSGGNGG